MNTTRPLLSKRFTLAAGTSLLLLSVTWLLLFLQTGLNQSSQSNLAIVRKDPSFTVPIHTSRIRSAHGSTTQQLAKKLIPETRKIKNNKLVLRNLEKHYTFVFSGKVTCGDKPCHMANIKVRMESRQNPQVARTIPIQPDGTYEVSIFLREALNEHMDYWIVADSPDSATSQVRGREILMEDSIIRIEKPIHLL